MQQLHNMIQSGWPEVKQKVPLSLRQYFGFRSELVTNDGLIFKGQQVIIPTDIRPEIIKKLNQSHQGVQSTLRRARDVVFWPGMTGHITEAV